MWMLVSYFYQLTFKLLPNIIKTVGYTLKKHYLINYFFFRFQFGWIAKRINVFCCCPPPSATRSTSKVLSTIWRRKNSQKATLSWYTSLNLSRFCKYFNSASIARLSLLPYPDCLSFFKFIQSTLTT